MPLSTYQQLLAHYSLDGTALSKKLRALSLFRLLCFIGAIVCGYYYFTRHLSFLLFLSLLLLAAFFYLVKLYSKTRDKLVLTRALITVNKNEVDILNGSSSVYAEGKEYFDPHHPYSYDLDIFGPGSLFQFLNRTTTIAGKENLAKSLLQPDAHIIRDRQLAVKELSDHIELRQHIQASGMTHTIETAELNKLEAWISEPPTFKNAIRYYVLFIFPAITIASGLAYIVTEKELFLSIFQLTIPVNLAITFLFAKRMIKHIAMSEAINKVLQQLAEQFKLVEKASFKSGLLLQLQSRLKAGAVPSSRAISRLVELFNYMDTLFNLLISILFNGLFLFNVHVLFSLDKWRSKNGNKIKDWLDALGEMESLSSFSNLFFNNKDFCFPEISNTEDLTASALGHPLIRREKRIVNDISFREHKFVVLTGSNMSGKSTFLRTLGINLVLARAGSAVCAHQFTLYPYDVYVSMRISDSLQDSESLFYAELKRLQSIIQHLQAGNKTFVILDEILRGTNSNDKHHGTVGLIRKLARSSACGIIATHDLTVSKLATQYPGYINNECFESRIINDELLFDYKLRDGVCTTLSASFLMNKMGVIDGDETAAS